MNESSFQKHHQTVACILTKMELKGIGIAAACRNLVSNRILLRTVLVHEVNREELVYKNSTGTGTVLHPSCIVRTGLVVPTDTYRA